MTPPPPRPTLHRFEEIDSTSLHARREAVIGTPSPRVYVAARQTGGVGRFRRAWSSPEGGLWMTLSCPMAPAAADGLGLRVGLACCEAIEAALARAGRAHTVALKWPNDVMLGGRKVCGVLCEIVPTPAGGVALIGVGVNANFNVEALPEGLRARAGTLLDLAGAHTDLDALREDLTDRLLAALGERGVSAALVAAARARLFGVGEKATITVAGGARVEGALLGLTDDGRPTLRTAEGVWEAPAGSEILLG